MKSLQQIIKANGQNPNQAFQAGKLTFDKKVGCLVYNPPGINNFIKENKSAKKESLPQQ